MGFTIQTKFLSQPSVSLKALLGMGKIEQWYKWIVRKKILLTSDFVQVIGNIATDRLMSLTVYNLINQSAA